MAIITIIFAAVLPQFRVINNSWDSRQANTEVLQSGRVLIDHINRNLSKAVRITAVEPNVYIQFLDNDSNTYQYDINPTSSYVRYGRVGYTLSDLAGPVSSLTFTCYDACDTPLSSPIDVNSIRFVKAETTLVNSVSASRNKTLIASAYLRTNANNGGIVGCWKLDETSGIVAADSSGNGNDGTLVNMTPPGCWVSGQIGGALDFDGLDDVVECGNPPSLQLSGTEISVSAWFNADTLVFGNWPSLVGKTSNGDWADGWGIYFYNNNICFYINDWSANVAYKAFTETGLWHHVVGTYDGTEIKIYVDGVKGTDDTYSGAIDDGGDVTIGEIGGWTSGCWDGRIDDVRIYNRALSTDEITQLANILTYKGFSEGKAPSDSNTSVVIPKPSGTAQGDLLIAAVATDEDTSGSLTTSGWTQQIDLGACSGQATLGAWYKIAGASEPASYNFSWTGGQQAYGWIMRFTGYDTVSPSPINTSATDNQNIANPTSPAVTTTVPNCLILRLGAFDDDDVTIDNPGLSSPPHTAITMDESAAATSTTVTFVAAGNVASGTAAITPARPAGIVTGDILLLFLETANQAISIANPNGGTWTQVANSPQGTGTAGGTSATRLTVFWSRYNGTQGNPTTSDSGDHQIGRILAFRGVVSSGDPWDVTAGGVEAAADTSGSIPGATTTVANTLVVAAIATALPDATGTANFSNVWTNSDLTSVTERTDNTRNPNNGGGLGTATGVKATAGAYSNTAVTCAVASYKAMMSIALKPQVNGGTVSGGAGYAKQATAGPSSGTPTFLFPTANEARMLTIAIAPADNGGYDCCGDYLQP